MTIENFLPAWPAVDKFVAEKFAEVNLPLNVSYKITTNLTCENFYDKIHWKHCTPRIHRIKKFKYKFKLNQNLNLSLYRKMPRNLIFSI